MFRRKRDVWDDFLSRHGPALRACGIPDFVCANRWRFLAFLDNGFDEWAVAENNLAFFDAATLTDEQLDRLADLLTHHVNTRTGEQVASRWGRRPRPIEVDGDDIPES